MKQDATMTRREFLSRAAVGTAAGIAAGALPGVPRANDCEPKPNIVFILADDLGYGELGSSGQRMIKTPHLDELARQGIRFTDFYAGSTVCSPSRCSLLTGLHMGHSRVRANETTNLLPEDVTFAEVLRSAGYSTALFGKFGIGTGQADYPGHPNNKGFDEFFGYIDNVSAQDYFPASLWENHQTVELPENQIANTTYAPDLFTARALDFIQRKKDGPFLLYLNYSLCHAPNIVPSDEPYSDESWPAAEKAHAAQVTLLDGYVGGIVAKLKEIGIADNTIVFFTSDNGPHEEGGYPPYTDDPGKLHDPEFFSSNGRLRGYKRNLYEGGIRVPMIVWSPALLGSPGTVSDQVWAFWDVLPTLADLAGARPPTDIDGISMRAALKGKKQQDHDYLFWERSEPVPFPRAFLEEAGRQNGVAQALRRGKWKAIRFAPGLVRAPDALWSVELYDLSNDAGETNDLAAQHPEVVSELVALMNSAYVPPPFERAPFTPGAVCASDGAVLGASASAAWRGIPFLPAATLGVGALAIRLRGRVSNADLATPRQEPLQERKGE